LLRPWLDFRSASVGDLGGTLRPLVRAVSFVLAIGWLLGSAAIATAAGAQPLINSGFADRPIEPTRFSPPNVGDLNASAAADNYVREISWSTWGGSTAVGTGKVSLVDLADGEFEIKNGELPARTSPVTVTLGGLGTCAGISIYTSYELKLAPGAQAPSTWPKGQRGRFPCSISATAFRPLSRSVMEGKVGEGNCSFRGLTLPVADPDLAGSPPLKQPRWIPHNPPGKGLTVFCDMSWKHWGGRVVTADGLRENLTLPHSAERNWPVHVILRHPIWCPAAAGENNVLTYSELTVVEYGSGRVVSSWSLSHYGHRGLKAHVFRQSFRADVGQCQFGISIANLAPPGWSPYPK
jgi:hypothetical protein